MKKKYKCLVCGWTGDKPKHSHKEGGWLTCPNECIDQNGDLEEVIDFLKYMWRIR